VQEAFRFVVLWPAVCVISQVESCGEVHFEHASNQQLKTLDLLPSREKLLDLPDQVVDPLTQTSPQAPVVRDHAARHGWSRRQTNEVIRSLRLLQVLQDTPGAKIRATEVAELPRYDGNITSTLDVLAAADMLIDDRVSHVERSFAAKTAHLPEPMKAQLEIWLKVMLDGSSTAPRQRSRDPQAARIHIMGIAPIIEAWADAGHQPLAEITPAQVRAARPPTGSRRNWAEYGLRSLFKVLKARKLIFANPTRGMPITAVNATAPLPLDTAAVRQALDSADPAIALAVALVAFHALTAQQLAGLQLTDIVDGRLHLDGRDIPLAGPVRVRLGAWLDHRNRTWPASINPHLFVGRVSAPRLVPVGKQFRWRGTGLRPQALREDRILAEIHATDVDVRPVRHHHRNRHALRHHPRTSRPRPPERKAHVYLPGQVSV